MYELSLLSASIRRRGRLAIGLFIVLLAIGSAAVLLMPRTYATSSQVLIKRPDTALQSTTYPQIDALLSWKSDTAMETYVALAQQPSIAEKVVRELNLRTNAKDLIGKNVVVTPLTNADIINISVDWSNPFDSANVANAFARAFIERQRALAASQASEAAASLAVALNKARTDLSSAERALTLFESQHQLADATTQTTTILSAISEIQSKERTLEADRVQAQGQLSSINGQLTSTRETIDASKLVSSSPVADQIEQQLAQQRLQLSLLRQQFTEKYPDVVATEKQIASLESALAALPRTKLTSTNVEPNPLSATLAGQAATLHAQIAGDFAQLGVLRSQAASLQSELRVFPGDVSELSTLQRQEKAAETIYDALQNNYFNAVVAKSMAVSDLSVVQFADPELATVRPPRMLALLAVSLVAVLATLAIVGLLEWPVVGSMSLSESR